MPKSEGKKFEEDFRNSFDEDKIYVERMKDSGSSFGINNNSKGFNPNLRFTINNPYDMFGYKYPILFCLELKSTKGTSFSIAQNKKDKKQIKFNQIQGLEKTVYHKGIAGGFIFNFRSNNYNTYFLGIDEFIKFNKETNKKSINEKDILNLNHIKINSFIKRTRYKYDIDCFINELLKDFEK